MKNSSAIKAIIKTCLLALPVCSLPGCVYGFVYSNTTDPVTIKMQDTPVGTKVAKLHSDQLQAPVGNVDISAVWNSRAIGDAAKRAGLNQVYYADQHTISILGGIWERDTIVVHGD